MDYARLTVGMVLNAYHRKDVSVMSGAIQSTIDFADALRAKGHIVYVFTTGGGVFKDEGIDKNHVFRCFSVPFKQGFGPTLASFYGVSFFDESADAALETLDVVHCQHPPFAFSQLSTYAQQVAKRRNIPCILTNHTQYLKYMKSYFPGYNLFGPEFRAGANNLVLGGVKKFVDDCDLVIVPGKKVAGILKSEYNYTTTIAVCPNGIDYDLFRRGEGSAVAMQYGLLGKDVLIYTGRLEKEKKIDDLLDVMKKISSQNSSAVLMIVGGGSQKDALVEKAVALGLKKKQKRPENFSLEDRVIFVGRVPHDDMPDYYAAADFLDSASDSEVHPLICLEAMAVGCVPITYSTPGFIDIVNHGEDGILSTNDVDGLASAILSMISDPAGRKRMSLNAIKNSERFSREHAAENLLEIYYREIARKKQMVKVG